MADVVEREDVNEAMRLMEMSKQSLYDDEQSSRWVWSHYYFRDWRLRRDLVGVCVQLMPYMESSGR